MKAANPDDKRWLQADAKDLNSALQESMKGVWNRDEDLLDGKLPEQRAGYEKRRQEVKDPPTLELAAQSQRDKTFLNDKVQAREKPMRRHQRRSSRI